MGYLIKMKPESVQKKQRMLNFSPHPWLAHFGATLVLRRTRAWVSFMMCGIHMNKSHFFFSRNKSHSSAIIKRKKGYSNSKVVENLSCVF